MPTRVLLADDHAILRQGIKRILESHADLAVVAEASTGLEAIRMAELHRPDVAVVDIAMKDLNGIEATSSIRRASPSTAVLVLSMHADESYVVRSVRAGACGYILKDAVEDELILAIHAVSRRGQFFSPAIAEIVRRGGLQPSKTAGTVDNFDLLTRTERIIYQMLAEGNANKEIGAKLNISVHTVETHRAHVMEKMGFHSVTELVLSAVRRGIVH